MENQEIFPCDKCGYGSLDEKICTHCGKPIESLDLENDRFVPRIGNNFVLVTECITCHMVAPIKFQAKVGRWQYEDFVLGDDVFIKALKIHPDEADYKPLLDDLRSWHDLDKVDFWVYGAGQCHYCDVQNWARIEIHSNKVNKIVPVEAPMNRNYETTLKWWLLE